MYSWLAESLGRMVSIMYVYDWYSSDGTRVLQYGRLYTVLPFLTLAFLIPPSLFVFAPSNRSHLPHSRAHVRASNDLSKLVIAWRTLSTL